jgi:hypothetical protein
MSFLKQILTPFVEFDEHKKKEILTESRAAAPPVAKPSPPAASAPPPVDQIAEHPLITGVGPGNLSDEIPSYSPAGTLATALPEHEQYFENLIDEANKKNPLFQGVDYKEFADSKLDIDDITDEALKYKTAYNVLKSTGLTKEKLLATGQEYINLIGRDLNAFQSAQAQQYNKEVRQKELLIQKKAEELQALTQRINALKGEINSLTQEISLTKEKLDTTKNSFLLAGERKQNEIQTELEKIARYF